MGKTYGKNVGKFAGSWQVQRQSPLDDRGTVDTYANLLDPDTWKGDDGAYYHYKGMHVTCADTGAIYSYIGKSGDTDKVKDATYWVKAGNVYSAGDGIVSSNLSANNEIKVDFGDPQLNLVYEIFGYEASSGSSSVKTVYDSGNGGTATYHASVVWDAENNDLYVYLNTSLAIGATGLCTYSADGLSSMIYVSSKNGASGDTGAGTSVNNYGKTHFATAPAAIIITPATALSGTDWHWIVSENSRSVVSLNLES